MAGKNHRLCHSCRCKGHFFADCPKKRLCPWCKRSYVKCFEVEKETKNKGKLFNCYGGKCGFWEWVGDGESSCKSSVDSATSTTAATKESVADVMGLFKSSLRLSDKHKFKVSVKVSIHKNNISVEVNDKRKA